MIKKLVLVLLFAFIAVNSHAGLRDGLILHYSFNQNQGSAVTDESGQNHTGSVAGATFTADGRFNGAYSFDGVDDFILAGNLGYHEVGTISFWMNADVVENWRNPFSTDYASWDDNIRFETSSTGTFFGGGHGLGRGDLFMTAMEPQRWYHVAYVWDQTYVYGYLDGNLIFKNPHPPAWSKVHPDLPLSAGQYKATTLNFSNVAIGNGYSTEANRYWKGRIDEVRIYDRPLSAQEVLLLNQGREDSLILHYSFDTNNAPAVVDQSGVGHDATVTGALFTSAGKINAAYSFDGIDDAIHVPQRSTFEIKDDFTVAVWFFAKSAQEGPLVEWANGPSKGVQLWTNAQAGEWNGKGTGINLTNGSTQNTISVANPAINQWHHLAATFTKSTGRGVVYLDGIKVAEQTFTGLAPLTALPVVIGRDPASAKTFNGLLDDPRVYSKALSASDIRALYDAYTHGRVYQNFENDNGSGPEYGWPIGPVTTTRMTQQKHAGSYGWKLVVPSGTAIWNGGTGLKAQKDAWNFNLQAERHDRLTFWMLAQPNGSAPQTVRVKFFDHDQYVWDPAHNKDGFTAAIEQRLPAGVWTQGTILLSQLPSNFEFNNLDKIEIFVQNPGTYYIDDIEITSADRVYQSFEARAGVTTPDPNEYGWAWNGTGALITAAPAEGLRSWLLTATNVPPDWSGMGLKYQGKWFGDTGTVNDIWDTALRPSRMNPPLYDELTFSFKQTGNNKLANNIEVGFFDTGLYNGGQKIWTDQRGNYNEWARLAIPLAKLPANFNFDHLSKIEMAVFWGGGYNIDDIRVPKYPALTIDESRIRSGLIEWPAIPGAVKYVLERSSSGQGGWSTVYSGPLNSYQTTSLTPYWFRVRWESDLNSARATVPYISGTSEAFKYEPLPVLIRKDSLQAGSVEWTFIPQASLYEVQSGTTRFGPWTQIYQGAYKVPPAIPASVGKWYRARAIQKNASGGVSATGNWSPALLHDPSAFVTAQGTALYDKSTGGHLLKLTGMNLGSYLLIEPWMMFGSGHAFVNTFPDDWTIRQTLINRPAIGLAGWKTLQRQYQQAYLKESDLDKLVEMGVNFVRLPLLAYDLRTYNDAGQWTQSAFDFSAIDRMIKLCADRGLYVLLDLHGAPGAQSKEFHTGRRNWNQLFNPANDAFRQRTVELWKALAERYRDNPSVMGYDVLNEPFGALSPEYFATPQAGYTALWSLYDRIYDAIRNSPGQNGAGDLKHLIVFEAIPSGRDWDTLPNPATYGWQNVMYQLHYYGFAFGEKGETNGTLTYDQHVAYLADKVQFSRQAEFNVPVLIGEFNGFNEARTWELLTNTFNTQGWNWSPWSYKHRDTSTDWGLYWHTLYNDAVPDPANDALEVLNRKLARYTTEDYHRRHNSLFGILKSKAKLPGYIPNLTAASGNRSVTLSWSEPYTASPVTSYKVRYGTVASGGFASVVTDNAVPGITISNLTNGVSYQFRVEAVTAEGAGPQSNTVTGQPHL